MPELPETILDPAIIANPGPTLDLLLEHAPVFRDEVMGAWIITRYDDVKSIFADDRFSRDRRRGQHYIPPAPGTRLLGREARRRRDVTFRW